MEAIQHAFDYNKSRWDSKNKELTYQVGDAVKVLTKFFSL